MGRMGRDGKDGKRWKGWEGIERMGRDGKNGKDGKGGKGWKGWKGWEGDLTKLFNYNYVKNINSYLKIYYIIFTDKLIVFGFKISVLEETTNYNYYKK